jgi:hypothetical protein
LAMRLKHDGGSELIGAAGESDCSVFPVGC